ncbi:STY4851/ECs_5259 family protein [Erythrobacter cryptus]|uniref:STY4851/ECs_5259 family protein n=1 Tax=Erythrobacter cryptus TaxID=196588 RepID=UPI0012EC37C2|nr:STY4851/ECs_5259 family protein [Erythrobacter cryptus]
MIDDLAYWRRRIAEGNSLEELDRLYAEAEALPEDLRRQVYLRIAQAKTKMRAQNKASEPPPFAASLGLPCPDGRPLHRYRLSDKAYDRLGMSLKGKRNLTEFGNGHLPAHFVLWASEWFRREYDGGGYSWAGLLAALDLRVTSQADQAILRNVAERGLQMWIRPVLQWDGRRSFLGSLAREGGFPTAAFADGKGWARDVLGRMIASLLSEPAAGEERALELARLQRHHLPQTFNDDDFLLLCADLALAVVAIRREAEPGATAEGIPVLAWLGLHRPDWRESLPIITGDRAADALIESLMSVEALAGVGVGADRMLWRQADGTWVEAARIALDGDVDSQAMPPIQGNPGRLRVFAADDLARHLPGELGMLEPPAPGGTTWTARSTRLVRGIHAIPFAAALTVELRVGARNLARFLLPGGKPRRGQLLVATAEDNGAAVPALLKIVGSGSGQYRAQTLFLQVPDSWQVSATDQETAEFLGQGVGATHLWRIQGGAFVTDDTGDRYRIRCGQPTDATPRIDMVGNDCRWAEVSGNIDLFCGPPHATMRGQVGKLLMRDKGTRIWRPAPSPLPLGHYELGWRAPDGILLDRRTIAVLPASASLVCRRSASGPSYELQGFGKVRLVPDEGAPVVPDADGQMWKSRPQVARVHFFSARIMWPDGTSLLVKIRYPGDAAIARWDGTVLPHNSVLTLDDLRDLVGIDEGRMELHAELREPRAGKVAQMVWEFDRELPLASIREDCASLLLPASINAELLLDMHDGRNTHWRIKPFALSLVEEPAGFVARPAVAHPDVLFCGRSLADPAQEVCFGPYSLLSDANHRPVRLPHDRGGAWLVYLRRDKTVLTRPKVAFGQGRSMLPTGHLARAMIQPPGAVLDQSLNQLLIEASDDDQNAREIVHELIALARSLNGLPPGTFRVFELLVDHPVVLARMAQEEPESALPLSEALPFAWFLLPSEAWEKGAKIVFEDLIARLASLPQPDQLRFAAEEVKRRRQIITNYEPILVGLFDPPKPEPIQAIVQRFANRAIQRLREDSIDRYRSVLGNRLPSAFTNFDRGFIDTFDAPCAAALAAACVWRPDAAAVRHMKTVARTFPTYFAEAYAAWLKSTNR